jgi:hypothetical protein
MKFKVIVSLLLAVLMIGAVVTPVLADRAAGDLEALASEPGTGKYSIRTTNGNHLKVTVSLKGATADSTYVVKVWSSDLAYYAQAGTFMTDSKGNGRFSRFAVTDYPSDLAPRAFPAGTWHFQVLVFRLTNLVFQGGLVDQVTFK